MEIIIGIGIIYIIYRLFLYGKDKKNNQSKDREIGGVKGPEPTRYGDWEKNGRCTDF